MTHRLRYAARTDRGLLRANNQDSVYAGDRLLIIADGMGGHAAGDVASRLVVAAFMPLDELAPGAEMRGPLIDATHEGNAAIAEMVDENPELDGMGTTLTALLFDGPQVALAHVGDSRAYLYRNSVLHQISHDDTFVQSLVDDGRITSDEAVHHPQRSLLLRALNGSDMDPTITLREILPGDRFLICSDGLSDYVSPESIADTLTGADPDQVADTLIQLALVAGGPDNVTVIVADVVETGALPAAAAPPAVPADPDATGPLQAMQLTQKFPRVPLPPIPEEPAAKPEFATETSESEDLEDLDDMDDLEDEADQVARPGRPMISAPSRGRGARRSAFVLALVVLVGVALTGTYLWTRSKYYVGADNGQVVVFRGVSGSLLGLRFAGVQENSCSISETGCPMQVTDLQQDARDQVGAGIAVGSLTEARAVISRLLSDKQLPICQPVSAAASSPPQGTTASSRAAPATTMADPSRGGTAGVVTISSGTGTAPLTTTILTTVSAESPDVRSAESSGVSSSGERVRLPQGATVPPPSKTTPSKTTPTKTAPTKTGPRTANDTAPPSTPTVTVYSTVTATRAPTGGGDGSTAIVLTSATQEAGVNCRSPR